MGGGVSVILVFKIQWPDVQIFLPAGIYYIYYSYTYNVLHIMHNTYMYTDTFHISLAWNGIKTFIVHTIVVRGHLWLSVSLMLFYSYSVLPIAVYSEWWQDSVSLQSFWYSQTFEFDSSFCWLSWKFLPCYCSKSAKVVYSAR